MDVKSIFSLLHKSDPEVYERISPRRHILKSFSSKVAVAALPFALGSFLKKAYGQSDKVILDALNFALTLEYLEAAFYKQALAKTNFPAYAKPAIEKISKDEDAHVTFLKFVIGNTGSTVVTSPIFDFTGGKGSGQGPFKNVFTDYPTFLAAAQTFEDTGVRAYKGQVEGLMVNNEFLTAAVNIHSVEARHAARIRILRYQHGERFVKPWILNSDSQTANPYLQQSYIGEDNVMQAGINITDLNGATISSMTASAAFDEPLIKEDVLKLIDKFIVA